MCAVAPGDAVFPSDGDPSDGEASADDAPPSLEDRDWREVRASLQAGGARALALSRAAASRKEFHAFPLALPEVGCCLASHPAYYRRQKQFLTQAVVFLTAHSSAGSSGLVLNRPLAATAGDLLSAGVFGRSCVLADELHASPVYLGGSEGFDDGRPVMAVHGIDVKGAAEPLPGVFVSGVEELAPMLASGRLQAEEVRLFSGCTKWEPGELERETDANEWFIASASAAFPLKQCIGLPTPLWRELMCAMGPVHEQIARHVFED